ASAAPPPEAGVGPPIGPKCSDDRPSPSEPPPPERRPLEAPPVKPSPTEVDEVPDADSDSGSILGGGGGGGGGVVGLESRFIRRMRSLMPPPPKPEWPRLPPLILAAMLSRLRSKM